jgi:FkbM family methyltransferase
MQSLVRPGDTVVDIGANVGYVAAQLASMVGPEGKVYAFEPGPTPLAYLRAVVDSNIYANIEAFPCALSDRCGMAAYFETDAILAKGYGRIDCRPSARFIHVRQENVGVTTLDRFFASRDTGRLSFIKIDVEGHEKQVLQGMEGLLASGCRPTIMTEVTLNQTGFYELRDSAAFLEQFGYSLWRFGPLRRATISDLPSGFHGNVLWDTRSE